jgi:perosamine synthetase
MKRTVREKSARNPQSAIRNPQSAIPHSRPSRAPGDLEALTRVLESGHLAAGPEARKLEEEVARSLGRRWAVATSNGQAALHLALLALEIGPGDRVAIPSYVCASVLNAVRYVGAREALVDCSAVSFNLDPRSPALAGARAIIAPHLFGFPAPLGPLLDAARASGAAVIEDCAMAIGAEVDGRPAGSSGTLAIVSLYATKMATCGQGGLLLGDDPRLEARARDLTDYDNRPEYRLRYNYQLTDLQAALARRQWSALGGFVEARRRLAARYDRGIDFERAARLGGKAAPPGDGAPGRPCYFRYPVDVGGAAALGRIREHLASEGIEAKPPVHRPLHRYLGLPDRDFPNASRLQDGLLSIPIYPSLTDAEADRVISALNRAMETK